MCAGTGISTQCPAAAAYAAALFTLANLWLPNPSLNWDASTNPCTNGWTGVNCDFDGAVTKISLANSGLGGTIPMVIGAVTSLNILDFSFNELIGELPTELVNLTSLLSLSLISNAGLW